MKKIGTKIFVVEDDNFFATMVKEFLSKNAFKDIAVFNSGEAALEQLHEGPEIVILDYQLGKISGLDVLRKIKSVNPNTQVIFLSGQEKMTVAIKALKYGAYDYLEKGAGNLERLKHLIERILKHNALANENLYFRKVRRLFLIVMFGLLCSVAIIGMKYPNLFQ